MLLLAAVSACGPKLVDPLDESPSESESESESGESGDVGHDPVGESAGGSLCDPIEQDCGGGMGCYPSELDNPFECLPITCGGGECPNEGESCLNINDCLPGLVCIAGPRLLDCADEVACCARYCDLGAPSCPQGAVCEAYFDDAPSGLGHVGVCVAPP